MIPCIAPPLTHMDTDVEELSEKLKAYSITISEHIAPSEWCW